MDSWGASDMLDEMIEKWLAEHLEWPIKDRDACDFDNEKRNR